MTIGRSTQGSFGYVKSGLSGVHRDPTKWIALKEDPTFTPEIVQIDSRLFTPGAYHQSIERLQGMFNCSGSFVMALHPAEGIEFVKGVLGSVTSSQLTGAGSGIYEHEFVGVDTVPMAEGFSLTVDYDLKVTYISGVIVTSVELGAEINGEVLATVNWIGRKWETAAAGTAGTSQGQNAVSLPVTFVVGVSDDFKLAIDGGTAYECTITAGAYATAATLEAAINTAIKAQTSLRDTDGLPEVACFVDSSNKVNFYTADKGIAASVAWTAGTHTASTLMGMGTPVEAAGTAAITTPSYSSVQPFCATQLSVSQDSISMCASSCKVLIDAKLVARNCLGAKYMSEAKIDGKREITLTLTKEYEDETQVTAWVANSDVAFELTLRTNTEIVAASGINYDADLYFKKCRINNTPQPTFNAQGAITQEISATSFYYDSTYKDCKFDINNTMSSI
jgi:hypothetical protein